MPQNPKSERDSIELLRLRAEARALLEDTSRPPNLHVCFYTRAGQCESRTAQGPDGTTYNRLESESQEAFEERVLAHQLVLSEFPTTVIFWPVIDPNDPDNSDVEPCDR